MGRGVKVSRNALLIVLLTSDFLMFSWLLTHLLPDWFGYGIEDVLLCGFITLLVLVGATRLKMSQTMKRLVVISYFIRLFLALIAAYGTGAFAFFLYNVDDIYSAALRFFAGDFSFWYTNYTPFLYGLFQFTGPDKIAPTLLNILFWLLGYFVIQVAVGDLYGKENRFYILFYTFLPMELLFSVKIAREAIIWLSLMLSFCFVLKWAKSGKILHIVFSVLMVLPAIYMHRGNTAMWIAVFLIYIFWSPKKRQWKLINRKVALIPILAVLAIPLYRLFFAGAASIASLGDVLDNLTASASRGAIYYSGRASYINWDISYKSPVQFIINSLYLMFYFWMSPTPRYWNSPIDIIGAMLDTIPWIVFYYIYFKEMKKSGSDRRALAGIVVALVFTAVFGWGTFNAGTAMRHRGKLYGVMTMAALVAAKRPEPRPKERSL